MNHSILLASSQSFQKSSEISHLGVCFENKRVRETHRQVLKGAYLAVKSTGLKQTPEAKAFGRNCN